MSVSFFSALAIKKALDDTILPAFQKETGIVVDGVFEPTKALLRRIEDGARPDVLVGVTATVSALGGSGLVAADSIREVASVGIGIAVAPDGDSSDISTVDALIATLRSARSVAYSRTGASGIYFAQLMEKLGIADEVNARATVIEQGFTALAIVDGRADLAIQQLSELLFVPGVRIVGPLPADVQHRTEFSAATGVRASESAVKLLDALTGEHAMCAYEAAGLTRP
ncbi:molybdate ABC transporter substrate-binding protein [Fodinicola acaciae]|uniref:molybdate ABC transporter substrate-binding protein n=1 Tax=Fodinicola acaciae TaxID=2681555 RepID=UPI0013D43019|nr:substrate-binding domain-containing protein [Fodinicola acaciae]